jgi:hypothetical protein
MSKKNQRNRAWDITHLENRSYWVETIAWFHLKPYQTIDRVDFRLEIKRLGRCKPIPKRCWKLTKIAQT